MYWLTGILGFVLVAAPYIFGYADNSAALWTSIVIGMLTVVVSATERLQGDRENWEYWTVGILGLLTVAAPFVLGFNGITSARWTSVAVGVLIAVFAATRITAGQTRKV